MSEGFVIDTQDGIEFYALVSWRSAMGLEIKSGIKAHRNINCKTIIPALVFRGITDVQGPYTRPRKIKAYNDLNTYLVGRGAVDRPLVLK